MKQNKHVHKNIPIKSYTFKVRLEKDTFPSGKSGYFAIVPEWEERGAVAQGKTKTEALKNIQDILEMIVEEMTDTAMVVRSPFLFQKAMIHFSAKRYAQ